VARYVCKSVEFQCYPKWHSAVTTQCLVVGCSYGTGQKELLLITSCRAICF